MKGRKKQYRPIAGQTRFEKTLDWITREGNSYWSVIFLGIYAAIMFFGVWVLSNVIERSCASDLFMKIWFSVFPVVVLLAMINPCAAGWGLRAERKLQKPILDYVGQYGSRTYDELVRHCMPVKIHLGIDDALERLLCTQELALYVDEQGGTCYRLPTEEDRKRWHREFLEENGGKLTIEQVQTILAMDGRDFSDGVLIWFSLGEHDEFWMGKTVRDGSDEQAIWIRSDDVPYQEFLTLEELMQTKLIRGKSLYEVWDELTFLSVEGESPRSWFGRICGNL